MCLNKDLCIYQCVCDYTNVCLYITYVPMTTAFKRWHWEPWNHSYWCFSASLSVLATESKSSAKAVNVFNHQEPGAHFIKVISFKVLMYLSWESIYIKKVYLHKESHRKSVTLHVFLKSLSSLMFYCHSLMSTREKWLIIHLFCFFCSGIYENGLWCHSLVSHHPSDGMR